MISNTIFNTQIGKIGLLQIPFDIEIFLKPFTKKEIIELRYEWSRLYLDTNYLTKIKSCN